MIIVTSVGLFGPFGRVEVQTDRLRTWPIGSSQDVGGADLPLEVIGEYQLLDVDAPVGFCTDLFVWNGTALEPIQSEINTNGAVDAAQ
jgi:hypothetical protein